MPAQRRSVRWNRGGFDVEDRRRTERRSGPAERGRFDVGWARRAPLPSLPSAVPDPRQRWRGSRRFAEIAAWLERAEQIEAHLPHRSRALALNRRLALRIVDAHAAWLDEVEAELGAS